MGPFVQCIRSLLGIEDDAWRCLVILVSRISLLVYLTKLVLDVTRLGPSSVACGHAMLSILCLKSKL